MTFHYMTKLRNWEYGPVCIRNRMPKDYWVVSDLTHIICKHIINVLLPPTALNEVKINKIMYCVLLFIIIAIRQINDILLYYAKRNFSTVENKFLFTLHLLSTIYSHSFFLNRENVHDGRNLIKDLDVVIYWLWWRMLTFTEGEYC